MKLMKHLWMTEQSFGYLKRVCKVDLVVMGWMLLPNLSYQVIFGSQLTLYVLISYSMLASNWASFHEFPNNVPCMTRFTTIVTIKNSLWI